MALILSQGSVVCNRLVFEAVNENSISKLQSVIDNYNLTELLTSLIQCNENGETPLVVAIKGKNNVIIDKLVALFREDAEKQSTCERREVCLIAIKKLSQQIPVMEFLDYFVNDLCNQNWLEFIAKVFITSTSFTRQETIVALELIGASLVMNFEDNNSEHALMSECYIMFGLECWRKAMTLRYFPDSDGTEPLLPKISAVHVPSVASSVVFESAVEVMSLVELDELQQDFELVRDLGFLRIQALFDIRRICIQANHGYPFWFYLESLYQLALDSEDITYAVNTYLVVMEQITGIDPQMLSKKSFEIFIKTLWRLLSNFEFNGYDSDLGEEAGEVLFFSGNIMKIVECINTFVKFFPKPDMISHQFSLEDMSFSHIVCALMFAMESTQMTNQEEEELEKHFSNYISNFFPERTTTPLHEAADVCHLYCHSGNNELRQKPQKTTKRLLKLGADPNAIDESGRSALHLLAKHQEDFSEYELWDGLLPVFLPTFQALVDAGGHLDMASDDGDTVISILKENVMECKRSGCIVDPYFDSIINTVFPLSCYAARVIRRHGIRFDEDRLPPRLQKFVSNHSAKDFTE